ncbi:MAG: hypothetical protein Q4D38_01895 [Planctomycetia bacterium]|nr:hypothetical protein [Planctomycetia bacterium]
MRWILNAKSDVALCENVRDAIYNTSRRNSWCRPPLELAHHGSQNVAQNGNFKTR